ncbi:MAG: hypothetical protein PHN94_11030 [Bacteroidales bacterium]|nr:hypothetical protein [Bacteroidales bacterium]
MVAKIKKKDKKGMVAEAEKQIDKAEKAIDEKLVDNPNGKATKN